MSIEGTLRQRLRSKINRMVKLCVAIVTYILDVATKVIRKLLRIPSPGITVTIYYHQVHRENRERFAWQMDHLVRWARPICSDDLDFTVPESRRVVVTADDGWLSFAENALPELKKRNIPLTLFVASHRLGDNLGDPTDRLISESELLSLPRDLVTVGSHTATHVRLTTAPAGQIRRELVESRARLGNLLMADVRLFCFPFGAHNDEAVRLCRSAGYARGFGSQSTSPAQLSDGFLVQRVRVDPTDWPIEFHLKIMGAYRGPLFVATLKKQTLSAISARFARVVSAVEVPSVSDSQGRTTTNHHPDAGY